jgi:hypothetical protein
MCWAKYTSYNRACYRLRPVKVKYRHNPSMARNRQCLSQSWEDIDSEGYGRLSGLLEVFWILSNCDLLNCTHKANALYRVRDVLQLKTKVLEFLRAPCWLSGPYPAPEPLKSDTSQEGIFISWDILSTQMATREGGRKALVGSDHLVAQSVKSSGKWSDYSDHYLVTVSPPPSRVIC